MIDDKDSANISDRLVPGVWAGHVCWPVNWIWLYSLLLNLKHKMKSYILHGNRLLSSAFLLADNTCSNGWHDRCLHFPQLRYQSVLLLCCHTYAKTCKPRQPRLPSSSQLWGVPGPDTPVSFFSTKIQSAARHVAYASNPNTWKAEGRTAMSLRQAYTI